MKAFLGKLLVSNGDFSRRVIEKHYCSERALVTAFGKVKSQGGTCMAQQSDEVLTAFRNWFPNHLGF